MENKCTNLPFLVLMQTSKAIHERIKEEMVKNNLGITEFSVLEVLYKKGKQTIQQIGNSILISSGTMTYVIDKLEHRGLLRRIACPNDRRAIHVKLTDDGYELMEAIIPKYHKLIEGIFDALHSNEAETLVDLLKRVKNNV